MLNFNISEIRFIDQTRTPTLMMSDGLMIYRRRVDRQQSSRYTDEV